MRCSSLQMTGSWRHCYARGTLTGGKRHRDRRHRDAGRGDGPNFMIWEIDFGNDFFVNTISKKNPDPPILVRLLLQKKQ